MSSGLHAAGDSDMSLDTQVQQLFGTNWREAKAATLQAVPLRPGGLPGVILAAGLRQAHIVSHQGHAMASLPLAVSL